MRPHFLSIIIPAYNEEKSIGACLQSIAELDYPRERYEIIVVDNGSTDKTPYIAERFGAVVLKNAAATVAGLRNHGAALAKGDILAFIDADCTVASDWLKNAEPYFDDRSVAAWGAPPIVPDDANWIQTTWFLLRQKPEIVQTVEWLESMNLFVRTPLFHKVKGFNEELMTCEDVDFSYRIGKLGRIVSDQRITVIHWGEADSIFGFIRKEIWRGRGNLDGILSHGISLTELPSLSIPVLFGVILPCLYVAALTTRHPTVLASIFFFYCIPNIGAFIKIHGKTDRVITILRFLFLMQFYFYARTVGVLSSGRRR